MKKLAAVCALSLLATSIVFAQNGTSSSKATAAYSTAVGCTYSATTNIGDTLPGSCHDIFSGASVPVTADNFVEVMGSTMKVSNSQSLFVNPSLVTGLYTNTKTQTKTGGNTSTAIAAGGVYLRAVLKDAPNGNILQYGYPVAECSNEILGCYAGNNGYGVIMDSRVQTLTQSLSNCVVSGTTSTGGTVSGTCDFTSTIGLILDTTSAHSYNFIFPNVGVGTYWVAIEAGVSSSATVSGYGTAIGGAAYGLGSLTVESVRLVHDFSF